MKTARNTTSVAVIAEGSNRVAPAAVTAKVPVRTLLMTVITKAVKLSLCCVCCAVSVAMLSACSTKSGNTEPVAGEEYMLDTICTVSVYEMKNDNGEPVPAAEEEARAQAAIDEAFELCDDLEGKFSRTISGSDISRINDAGGEWVTVSDETIDLIQKGIDYSRIADGDFDITVGGITELWNFHAAEGKEEIPDETALNAAAEHVGYENLETDGNKVRLRDPKTKIDLGGIAKGYVGDRMTERLESEGVASGIINLGGNVICIGGRSEDEDFIIGVEAPFSDRAEIIGKIPARDKTLVTSGVYERKIEKDGKLYHHILDTETGRPVETDLDAVTLISDKGRSADIDALSTICLIKGSADAIRLIEATEGVEGVFVLSDGSIRQTSGAEFEKP